MDLLLKLKHAVGRFFDICYKRSCRNYTECGMLRTYMYVRMYVRTCDTKTIDIVKSIIGLKRLHFYDIEYSQKTTTVTASTHG